MVNSLKEHQVRKFSVNIIEVLKKKNINSQYVSPLVFSDCFNYKFCINWCISNDITISQFKVNF